MVEDHQIQKYTVQGLQSPFYKIPHYPAISGNHRHEMICADAYVVFSLLGVKTWVNPSLRKVKNKNEKYNAYMLWRSYGIVPDRYFIYNNKFFFIEADRANKSMPDERKKMEIYFSLSKKLNIPFHVIYIILPAINIDGQRMTLQERSLQFWREIMQMRKGDMFLTLAYEDLPKVLKIENGVIEPTGKVFTSSKSIEKKEPVSLAELTSAPRFNL